MRIGAVDLNKLRAIGDKFVGLTKESIGTLAGNERLQREGDAQQDRAAEQLRAFRKEVEAERKEAKAEVFEQREKAAQRAKS
jgi:uncharacterized protein YjbJ (UPF0337 family)